MYNISFLFCIARFSILMYVLKFYSGLSSRNNMKTYSNRSKSLTFLKFSFLLTIPLPWQRLLMSNLARLILQISPGFFHLVVVVFSPFLSSFPPVLSPFSPSVPFLRLPPIQNWKLFKPSVRSPSRSVRIRRSKLEHFQL